MAPARTAPRAMGVLHMPGFTAFDDHGPRCSEFAGAMAEWVQADQVKVREDNPFDGLSGAS